ncbi:hypothetical protein HPB52_007929 [Rhipicephalus sanguineus]|uniref:HTH CENPB-type domain-containing protein n=1 Tax=Rhipicephalus sanguineus TaxID=34632 RepID=A0A9D4STZ8_RHISA|nr:hypothetical protein HPB52_007929 [Rhipicephalus sanguineus]
MTYAGLVDHGEGIGQKDELADHGLVFAFAPFDMSRETRFNGCSPINVDINASVTNRSNWSNQIKRRRLSPAVATVLTTFPVAVVWSCKVEIVLCGAVIQEKARQFAVTLGTSGFDASAGWLYRFRQRNGIMWQVACGEEKAADAESAIAWRNERFQEIVESFTPDDVFNADETALKLPTEVNIRQAAEMLRRSWWNVKASTISNCWRKAGLLETSLTPHGCKPRPRDCDDEAELDPELWNELTEKLPVDAAVTFEDYVDSHCAAATSAELTCEEIVSQVREQDCCSSDEDDAGDAESGTTEEAISSSDVLVFLEKTRSYLGFCKDVPEDILRKVADVEAYMHQRLLSTRQKKVTDFFKQ